jgi:hypothetical protein
MARNIVASVIDGKDIWLVKRDPVSYHLYSIARRGPYRTIPDELRQTFKDPHEAVEAIKDFLVQSIIVHHHS